MAKKILLKLPRTTYVAEVNREITLSDFEKHLVDVDKDFHSKYGIIPKKELAKKPGAVLRAGKEEFHLLDTSFLDLYKNLKRSAQIIGLKDIGIIIGRTGIHRESIVMDAGTGSGAFACFVAAIAKQVVSYDIDSERTSLGQKNACDLGLVNVEFKKGDVYKTETVKEKDIDVFLLDVPEPSKALKTAEKILNVGGYLVAYTPQIHQAQKVVISLPKNMLHECTIEVMEREWLVDEMRLRPNSGDMLHTAFLTFVRKLS
ncbi:MAG TPA: methyltransferase domain-containing protein [Candidatus Nanoarchaeia archaeon]|nr:methyltransferase domain-containing protein [Candidatus Nanoarchaeia archaeon]